MTILNDQDRENFLGTIRDLHDYPKEGIIFKDVTTLLNDAQQFSRLIEGLAARYESYNIDYIAGIDSRGFIFGAPLAVRLGLGFVPIRKKGKLPSETVSEKYSLEYGTDELEIHLDAFHGKKGAKVLLVDDLVATGGTAEAAARLIGRVDAECVEACFLMSLEFLDGRKKVEAITAVYSVLEVD
ncbi:MAG TPA: adenine phosphoribosyltransferase [Leucothrix mucor]|nr:adenine phosphoribosyltransferase [Leucothrix mucor]